MSAVNDDEWQYHQDGRDRAAAEGCIFLAAILLIMLAWIAWHVFCFISLLFA